MYSQVANSVCAHAWRMLLLFVVSTLSISMGQAKFLLVQILLKSGWYWNIKFGVLGQYDQKTIFQTKWLKNTDELKTYLV